jgi:antitoxin component of MazEF toxin-antitoxin module
MNDQFKPKTHGQVMALRRGRKSKLRIPVNPSEHIEIDLRTEYINGRPVVRYFLPEGGKILHERLPANHTEERTHKSPD